MKIFIYFSLFIFLDISAKGQAPPFHWAKDFYGAMAFSVGVDDSENTYVTGSFKGKVDLDPGSDTFYATSKGDYDIFISKFDFKGDLVWAKTLGDIGEDLSLSIKIDKSGNIYATGSFYGEVDFDPGAGIFNLICTSNVDPFILKLSNYGEFIWAKSFTGSGKEELSSLAVDDSSNVYIIGQFNAATDFDPGPGIYSLPLTYIPIAKHTYISKLNKDGSFIWARGILCRDYKSNTEPAGVAVDKKGNVYVTGELFGSVYINSPSPYFDFSFPSTFSFFTIKLNNVGQLMWAREFLDGTAVVSNCLDVKVDLEGNVYTMVSLKGIIDADPGVGIASVNCSGTFLSKLDSNGMYVWGKGMGGESGSVFDGSLSFDTFNNIYLTGPFKGNCDFDPGPSTYFMDAGLTKRDIFLSKLDHTGTFQWALQLSGPTHNQSRDIAVSKRGNIFTVGYFQDSIDYDPGIGKTYSLSKKGGAFLHKMSRCQTGSALTHAACNSFSIGRFTYSKTGKYKPFFTDGYGCDSIIDLSLDITSLSDSVTKTGATLTYSSTATTYQWVKCPSYSLVPGATGKSYTPASGGSYALIVSKGICTDTSKCIAVIPVNISESKMPMEVHLSPNPSNGVFYIETDNQAIGANLNIYNVVGQKVKSTTLKQTLTRESLNPGVYFIEIINAEERVVRKLIVN